MPICIPSKNRAGQMKTHLLFAGHDIKVFVEPQDLINYQKEYPHLEIIDIEKNDMGIGYVRNYILNFMSDQKFIIIDDDIFATTKYNAPTAEHKSCKYSSVDPSELISDIDRNLESCTVYGYVQPVYAGLHRELFSRRAIPVQFIGINGMTLDKNCRYDETLFALEDIDFGFSVILSGHSIRVTNTYCYRYDNKIPSNFFEDGSGNRRTLMTIAVEKLYDKYVRRNLTRFVSIRTRSKPVTRQVKFVCFNYRRFDKEFQKANLDRNVIDLAGEIPLTLSPTGKQIILGLQTENLDFDFVKPVNSIDLSAIEVKDKIEDLSERYGIPSISNRGDYFQTWVVQTGKNTYDIHCIVTSKESSGQTRYVRYCIRL